MNVTTTSVERHTRSKENTRQSLIEAAIDVFTEKGIEGATVEDLTSAAGFTRGAFYSNFSSKEEVFWESFSAVTDQAIAVTRKETIPSLTPEELCEEYSQADLLQILEALRPLGLEWYLLHTEAVTLALRNKEARRNLNEQRARLIGGIADSFTVLENLLPVKLALPPQVIGETLLGIYLNRMITELVAGENLSEETSKVIHSALEGFVKERSNTEE